MRYLVCLVLLLFPFNITTAGDESAENSYFRYRKELKNASNLDALLSFYSKDALEKLNKALKQGVEKDSILASLKKNLPDKVKIKKECRAGDVLYFFARGTLYGLPAEGVIRLKKEGETWKIDKRHWGDPGKVYYRYQKHCNSPLKGYNSFR
ncbi:MAG: hypothetical protein GF375_03715 [Candidatus Omnitrophica bacterium]|nr:hypothetical protein [Candidatus Omnitrophota bacterium]MBD3269168.1 hypothetical protein [Candidatus Omnitrophota bacterium]